MPAPPLVKDVSWASLRKTRTRPTETDKPAFDQFDKEKGQQEQTETTKQDEFADKDEKNL